MSFLKIPINLLIIISHKLSLTQEIMIKILNFNYSITQKVEMINLKNINPLLIRKARKSLKYFPQWSTLPNKNLHKILPLNQIQKISPIYHYIKIRLSKNPIELNNKRIKLTTTTKKICSFSSYKNSCYKNKNK